MADPVTMSDMALQAKELSDFRREVATETAAGIAATKDARYDVITAASRTEGNLSQQVDAIDDTLSAAITQVSRDTIDLRAQVTAIGYQVRDGFTAAAKDSEINGLKTQIEIAKQTTYLSDKIDSGNLKTVELLNSLKEADLNRMLIERNAELSEERYGRRHWYHAAGQGQWQAVNNQLQAFQSQLQETRQGMVNFGTMAGVGQSSTSNNVR